MLKISPDLQSEPVILRLDGKLVGPWVNELRLSWIALKNCDPELHVIVDLTEVTYIDARGKELLKSMLREGANLRSCSLMTRFIVDQIKKEFDHKQRTRNGA